MANHPPKTRPTRRHAAYVANTAPSTREYVHDCLDRLSTDYDDESPLSAITSDQTLLDGVGTCLNNSIPLVPPHAWNAGDIKSTWTVALLTSRTDNMRRH